MKTYRTDPEFSSKISKANAVVGPVEVEVNAAVLTSLKDLQTLRVVIIARMPISHRAVELDFKNLGFRF